MTVVRREGRPSKGRELGSATPATVVPRPRHALFELGLGWHVCAEGRTVSPGYAVSGCKTAHRNQTNSRATATVTTGPGLCSASRRKRRHNRCCALSAIAITRAQFVIRYFACTNLPL